MYEDDEDEDDEEDEEDDEDSSEPLMSEVVDPDIFRQRLRKIP